MLRWGREARVALDGARERLAACLGANGDEVCFTSGGTEGDNFAVLGVYRTLKEQGRTAAITTPIEHKAVLAAVHQVAHEGGEERLVRVTGDGLVEAAHLTALLDDRVDVASVMWVHNEAGVHQDVLALAAQPKSDDAVFHPSRSHASDNGHRAHRTSQCHLPTQPPAHTTTPAPATHNTATHAHTPPAHHHRPHNHLQGFPPHSSPTAAALSHDAPAAPTTPTATYTPTATTTSSHVNEKTTYIDPLDP